MFDKQFKKDVKLVNERIKQLEKQGYSSQSAIYQMIVSIQEQSYGVSEYFDYTRSGYTKFRTDFTKMKATMSKEDLVQFKNLVYSFKNAKTSQIVHLKDSERKDYNFLKSKGIDISKKDYALTKELVNSKFGGIEYLYKSMNDNDATYADNIKERYYEELYQVAKSFDIPRDDRLSKNLNRWQSQRNKPIY